MRKIPYLNIAHGLLVASFISTVLGTQLPGLGAIYLSQSLKFKAPVLIGDAVKATVTIREMIREKYKVAPNTQCFVRQNLVIEGEALITQSQSQMSHLLIRTVSLLIHDYLCVTYSPTPTLWYGYGPRDQGIMSRQLVVGRDQERCRGISFEGMLSFFRITQTLKRGELA